MDDKYNEREVNISGTAENDDEMELEAAVAAVTLPSTIRRTPLPNSTSSNHSSRVYSNSHHTQVRRSTDNREEDLLLESEENRRRQQYGSSDSRVRMQEPLAQTACFGKRDDDEFSRQPSSSGQLDEPVQSIAQPLENISLQSTTTPQQESCARHFDDPGRLKNATHLRRTGFVDVVRIRSK